MGLNEYIDKCRRNKYAANNIKKNIQADICKHIKRQRVRRMSSKVDVSFFWIEENMKRDKDNIAFAKKFILDAMVQMQIIPNDNWKWINNLSDKFAVNKANPRIIVTIEEIS